MRVFKAVAELGSFTAAAHAMSATQPFVSRTIQRLEARLGITLLRRSTRHLDLTAEGESFLASTNKLLADLDAIEADVSSWRSEFSDSKLISRKLTALKRIVVATPKYISERGMPKHPNDLVHHNCLRWDAPLEHLNNWPFVIDGKKVSIAIAGNFQCISGVASASMCAADVGIGRMAEHLALPAIGRGELVPLLQEFQDKDELGIYAVFVQERLMHPRIRAFVDYLVECFRTPPWTEQAGHLHAA